MSSRARRASRPAMAVGARATGVNASGPTAISALATGAAALGALAVGALAVGRLAIGKAVIRELEAGRVHLASLSVDELVVGGEPWTGRNGPDGPQTLAG